MTPGAGQRLLSSDRLPLCWAGIGHRGEVTRRPVDPVGEAAQRRCGPAGALGLVAVEPRRFDVASGESRGHSLALACRNHETIGQAAALGSRQGCCPAPARRHETPRVLSGRMFPGGCGTGRQSAKHAARSLTRWPASPAGYHVTPGGVAGPAMSRHPVTAAVPGA